MIPVNLDLKECNGVLIVFDSCRYDSALHAETCTLDSVGNLRVAETLSGYTPAAHTAMFLGHLPSTKEVPHMPYYNEVVRQLWRITTGPAHDTGKQCGILFKGNNVIEGFQQRGFYALGVGGVSQFSSGSFLRTAYPWSDFLYFGSDVNEEPLTPRAPGTFPLNHIEEIIDRLKGKEPWFLFISCPETHYPYDWGDGIEDDIQTLAFPYLKQVLNLRSATASHRVFKDLQPYAARLHGMQIRAVESMNMKLTWLICELRKISSLQTYFVVCSDHGECFGEDNLYGHMHPVSEVMQVPIWIGVI